MHHNTLVWNSKEFIIKVIFFIILLTFVALLYMESKLLIDAFYFCVVLVIFIRFLIIRLY